MADVKVEVSEDPKAQTQDEDAQVVFMSSTAASIWMGTATLSLMSLPRTSRDRSPA